jgi:hypothetical protein
VLIRISRIQAPNWTTALFCLLLTPHSVACDRILGNRPAKPLYPERVHHIWIITGHALIIRFCNLPRRCLKCDSFVQRDSQGRIELFQKSRLLAISFSAGVLNHFGSKTLSSNA